jgi:hypothetical protein
MQLGRRSPAGESRSSWRLPATLMRRAKLAAVEHNTTMTAIIVEALERELRRLDDDYVASQADVRTFVGGDV